MIVHVQIKTGLALHSLTAGFNLFLSQQSYFCTLDVIVGYSSFYNE